MTKELNISEKNLTKRLLRIIGSPFIPLENRAMPLNKEESFVLYEYAVKNKIGLIFLESLQEHGLLDELELQNKYLEEKKRHADQIRTAKRISQIFNTNNIDYAIFKSIMPFPATPNDVDIIHFGSDDEFERASNIMLQSEYMEVKGQVDSEQRMFHDIKIGGYLDPHPKNKDVFDVDVYNKISASYLQYLDKKKLKNYSKEIDFLDSRIKVLNPEAELIAIIIHSIIPEMLCTLFVYYATLYYFKNIDSNGIKKFIKIAAENNVTFAVRSHLSLIAELHQSAHGFIPPVIKDLLMEMSDEEREKKILVDTKLKMPYKYSLIAVGSILLEKAREMGFLRSAIKQAICMLRPKYALWILNEIIIRRKRETY